MYVFPQEDVRIDVCISPGDTGLDVQLVLLLFFQEIKRQRWVRYPKREGSTPEFKKRNE